MQFVWVLVFLSIVLVFLLPQNAEATEWYSGINLKEGDFFTFQACTYGSFNCDNPPIIDIWILDEHDEYWDVIMSILENSKITMTQFSLTKFGMLLFDSERMEKIDLANWSPDNKKLKKHINLYIRTINHIPYDYWRNIPIDLTKGGCCSTPIEESGIVISNTEIEVPAGNFSGYHLRPLMAGRNIGSVVVEGFAFAVFGDYSFVENTGYYFKLLNYGNSMLLSQFYNEYNEFVPPPQQQLKNGFLPQQVICKEGLELIFKSTDGSPACVKPTTAEKLIERGWASS